ncbi:MAG: acetyltransferase [Frankiales bacterium]|nr:acetyltransferase [Frankiales bacterium]
MSVQVGLAGPEDMDAVYALRHEVFVVGQDVPEDMERDEFDAGAEHAVARRDDVVVGTGRLLAPGVVAEHATVGRLAVAEAVRGQRVGAAVLDLLEALARGHGWPAVELHAQTHALGFYERAGYAAFGDVYDEAGIEHQSMRKTF